MTIFELVARERTRAARLVQIATSLRVAVVALVVLGVGATLLGGARWIELPRVVPFIVWFAAAAFAGVVAWHGAQVMRRMASPAAIAESVEREQRLRRGAVRGLVELANEGGVFVRRAAERLGAQLATIGDVLAPALHRRLSRGALGAAAMLVSITLLSALATGRRPDGWRALVHPVDAWRGTLLPRLEIDGAPRRALRGATVRFTVRGPGRSHVAIRRRTTGNAWAEMDVFLTKGVATAELGPLDADLSLVASDGRATSDTIVVRIVDRPFLGDVALRATFPAYLHKPAESLPFDGVLRLPRGTELAIEGHASEPLSAVTLAQGRDSIRLTPDDRRFRGRFTPTASGSWAWSARGMSAAIAEVPPPLTIEVVPDSAPLAEILAPSADTIVTPGGKVELQMVASDDHGLQSVALRVWRVWADGRSTTPALQKLSGGGTADWAGAATLDLAPFALEPGDAVHAQLTARDESPAGLEGNSREVVLKVAGVNEQRSAARAAADSAAAAAAAAAKAQGQLQQRTSDAAAQRSRPGDKSKGASQAMPYDGAQQNKQLSADQKQMSDRVQKLQQAAKQLEDRLRSAGALDTGLAAQLRQAQELLRQALTPEMLEALKKLDNSSQQLAPDQAKQSLADLVAQQKRMKEMLEKSAEILKRAALEGAMQTLKDEAKELAKAQRAMSDSARKAGGEQSRQLSNRTDQLAKDIEALRKRLQEEHADTAAKQASNALAQAMKSKSAMEKGQKGEKGEKQPGEKSGQPGGETGEPGGEKGEGDSAADAMDKAADALKEGRKAQVEEWKQELTGELDRSVQEMLQLARQQDQLAQKAKQNPADPGLRSEQSALQQGVQKASERLQNQSKRSALVSPRSQKAVSEAEQKVSQATKDASDPRSANQAQGSMADAAGALRQAAAALARDRERAGQSSSASGLPELLAQLQQLAQQQGALNGQMQSLMQQGQQGRQQGLSEDAKAQARGLARQQREVAKQLEEAGDADASGRSAELAREAKQLAQTLEQGAVDPSVFERQQRLFKRMLDAGRTLENDQKDESSKRESKPGDQSNPFLPPNGPASGRAAQRYRVPEWNELRGLGADERRLVIEYFRRLNGEKP